MVECTCRNGPAFALSLAHTRTRRSGHHDGSLKHIVASFERPLSC